MVLPIKSSMRVKKVKLPFLRILCLFILQAFKLNKFSKELILYIPVKK